MFTPFRSMFIFALAIFLALSIPLAAMAVSGVTWIRNGYITNDDTHSENDDFKTIEPGNAGFNRYTDYPKGYSLSVPADMSFDVSFSDICSVFSNEDTRIEIYYDNFTGTINTSQIYSSYGKDQITNFPKHQVITDETFWNESGLIHLLKWNRQKLSRVDHDKNHYACAEIRKNDQEVYTIFIKSSKPIHNERDIIRSFRFVSRQGVAGIYPRSHESRTPMNEETKACFAKFFNDQSPLRWGIFEPSAPENFDPLLELEGKLQHRFSFLIRYHTLEEKLPLYGLTQAYDEKRVVELTFQTYRATGDSSGLIYDILDGHFDDYLNEYAQKLKSFNHPVLFRLNNEMNGDWCKYSSYYSSKDTEVYKALWRYFHKIFDANGVDNVIWVWNPHDLSFPDFRWNHGFMYYPGDEYVDVVGMTGYNTGTYFPGEKWRAFPEVYKTLYSQYTTSFYKPFMLTEFGSSSVGGDKVRWIQEMFDQLPQYPQLKVAIWWSGIDYDEQGVAGRIYKLNETEATTQTFRDRLPKDIPASLKPRIEPTAKVK